MGLVVSGSSVLVQWSDGNRYPGTVLEVKEGRLLVSMTDGQQHWVEERYVTAAPAAAPASPALDPDVQAHWDALQARIARFESQGTSLCGIDPADAVSFWRVSETIDAAEREGVPREHKIRELGFDDAAHYRSVEEYISARWSHLTVGDDGKTEVATREEFYSGLAQVGWDELREAQEAAAQADPSLLAPVDGVSIETWARASLALATLGAEATQDAVAHALAQLDLDRAKYDAASAGWQAKMQSDTTGAVAQKYSEAFAAAQGVAGGWQQSGDPGEAPCTFEHYVEVGAAMSCWGKAGSDVDAELARVFGIDRLEYSRLASYWTPQIARDVALGRRMEELEEQFRTKYVVRDLDEDLVL